MTGRATARPSGSLRPRTPRTTALTAGVGGLATSPMATLTLESGAKIVWAQNASNFDLKDAMFSFNILDVEDIATAINEEDIPAINALVATQKMFRNEGDGTFQTMTVPKTFRQVLTRRARDLLRMHAMITGAARTRVQGRL